MSERNWRVSHVSSNHVINAEHDVLEHKVDALVQYCSNTIANALELL